MPFQYRVHTLPLVTITQGTIGYVFARDGLPLAPMQSLASNVRADDFTDVRRVPAERRAARPAAQDPARGHLRHQPRPVRGHHRRQGLLPAAQPRGGRQVPPHGGRHRRARAGSSPWSSGHGRPRRHRHRARRARLAQGEHHRPGRAATTRTTSRTYHNNFQDPERFLAAGGQRGRQLQVLVEGTYYINRLFATVETIPKTIIEVGTVGVVVSYTGDLGKDISGAEYKHGELVAKGTRGVWSEALLPGKYAFNTYAGKVLVVPTTNFILKWNRAEVGSHRYDENLSEVSLITKDAFEPLLPLERRRAHRLQEGAARHPALRRHQAPRRADARPDGQRLLQEHRQTRTLIELIQQRSEIQQRAGIEMREKFDHYNLELQEVLIGTPTSAPNDKAIETILIQLRSRQIAEEQIATYAQPAEGRRQGARAPRGRGQGAAAAASHGERDRHHRAGEPGQGRVPAQPAEGRADPRPGRGGGRAARRASASGRPSRRRSRSAPTAGRGSRSRRR